MTLKAWRLVKWKHAGDAFTGEGSRLFGSRWSSPGLPAVFVADSQALCALETIVHFEPGCTPPAHAFIPLTFDSSLVQQLPHTLPPNWGLMAAATVAIGDRWLTHPKNSCILALPTALVPEGWNFLLNPKHPDFPKISIGKPIPFAFDPRISAPAAVTAATRA